MRFEFDDLRRWQFTVVEISSGHYRVSAVRDGGDIRAESSGLQPEKMLEELKLWAATTEGELSALSGQHRNGARGPDEEPGPVHRKQDSHRLYAADQVYRFAGTDLQRVLDRAVALLVVHRLFRNS